MDTKGIQNASTIASGLGAGGIKKPEKAENAEAVHAESQAKSKKGFDVSLSGKAHEILEARQKAMQIAKDTSPIREDRVAEFREMIKNGTYKINAENIADGMLKEAIKDELSQSTEV